MFYLQCLTIEDNAEAKDQIEEAGSADLEAQVLTNNDDESEKEVEKTKTEVIETASIEKEVSKSVPEKRKFEESDHQPDAKRQRTEL